MQRVAPVGRHVRLIGAEAEVFAPVGRLAEHALEHRDEDVAIERFIEGAVDIAERRGIVEIDPIADIEVGAKLALHLLDLGPGNRLARHEVAAQLRAMGQSRQEEERVANALAQRGESFAPLLRGEAAGRIARDQHLAADARGARGFQRALNDFGLRGDIVIARFGHELWQQAHARHARLLVQLKHAHPILGLREEGQAVEVVLRYFLKGALISRQGGDVLARHAIGAVDQERTVVPGVVVVELQAILHLRPAEDERPGKERHARVCLGADLRHQLLILRLRLLARRFLLPSRVD